MARAAHDRSIRLADVAVAAGVSQGTVSNVFNRPDIVRPEVRERVHAAAEKLGYKGPDPRGRLLRAGKVNAIGVATTESLTHFFTDPYARALLSAIARHCEINGSGISLISTKNRDVLSWNVESALVDGLILLCLTGNDELIARARERNMPSVALSFGGNKPDLPVIDVDNRAGGRKAAAHLAELGHRRFAILGIEFEIGGSGWRTPAEIDAASYFTSRDRALGSIEALAAYGIPAAEIPVFETNEETSNIGEALDTLFGQEPRPTAIIAQSDVIAMAALDWFAARGINVPGEVSVIGFDGVAEAALTDPPLTTIAQPIPEIGRRAVEAILDPESAEPQRLFDAELIVRGSTAPPPKET